jgi:hypothetical protein
MRHLSLQLLPAVACRSVIVLEGPHDKAALEALAERLHAERGILLPAAHRVGLVDAAAADGSGGTGGVLRLAGWARKLGFHTVAVLDWDPGAGAERILAEALAAADAVVRLPQGYAIEKALVVDLDERVVRHTLLQLGSIYQVQLPSDLDDLGGGALVTAARRLLKTAGGLHAQFLELLPPRVEPPIAKRLLELAVGAAADTGTGHIQL